MTSSKRAKAQAKRNRQSKHTHVARKLPGRLVALRQLVTAEERRQRFKTSAIIDSCLDSFFADDRDKFGMTFLINPAETFVDMDRLPLHQQQGDGHPLSYRK